jgi:hypothetical protein
MNGKPHGPGKHTNKEGELRFVLYEAGKVIEFVDEEEYNSLVEEGKDSWLLENTE